MQELRKWGQRAATNLQYGAATDPSGVHASSERFSALLVRGHEGVLEQIVVFVQLSQRGVLAFVEAVWQAQRDAECLTKNPRDIGPELVVGLFR